jgi:hypothetical protein
LFRHGNNVCIFIMDQPLTLRKVNWRSRILWLLLFVFLGIFAFFQFFFKLNRQIRHLDVIPGPIVNPLMGWAPWANVKESYQPHTLVYADLTWRDFEPQEGVYEFDAFEMKQQLARWRMEGKRVVFRFVMDIPQENIHMDIPDWLFEKIKGDGDFYDNDYGKGFSPNYSNPILIKCHHLVIKELGDRYGKDGFFAFVEIGSLGHWGEWHENSVLTQLPAENIRELYVIDYAEAFSDTHLLMRRPFTIARKLKLGLYNDMTGDVLSTNTWLDWIKDGGDYLPNEKNTLVPMPDGWKIAPVGGEQIPDVSNEQIYGANLQVTLHLLKESHTSFIGPGGGYDVEFNGPLQSGLDQVLTTIGYRLYIDDAELPLVVKFGKTTKIKISFSNDGIAPFYYDWPTMVYLFDKNGMVVGSYPLEMDLRKILPNQIYPTEFLLPIEELGNGKYTVGFAIIDPLTGLPGVKLANETSRDDLIVEVGKFEIDRIFR